MNGATLMNNTFTTNVQNPTCGKPPPSNLLRCVENKPYVNGVTISANRGNGSLAACNN